MRFHATTSTRCSGGLGAGAGPAQSAKPQFMTGDYIPYSPTRSGVALRMRSCRQLPSPFASPFEADIRSNALSALRIASPIQALLSQFAPVSNVFEFPTFRTKSRKPASDEQNSPMAISSLSQRDGRRRRLQKLTSPPRCARALPIQKSDAGSKVGDRSGSAVLALACEAEGHKAVRLESKRKGRSAIPIMSLPEEM